jgi:hypothetical protein
MALSELIAEAGAGLTEARAPEVEAVAEAMRTSRIVGVLGEAEVGKTAVVEAALRSRPAGETLLRLDLEAAGGGEQLALMIVRQIATAFLGEAALSQLSGAVLVPASIESEWVALSRLIGADGLDEALRDWPSGTYPLKKALAALESFVAKRDALLWIDHPEAPSLTPRHPLDVDELLWGLRATVQGSDRLGLLISARDAFDSDLLGRDRALYEQGRWLALDNPPREAWQRVGAGLGVEVRLGEELFVLTRGHPATMLRALPIGASEKGRRGVDIVEELASVSEPLANRAFQHARSLHRLGGQVLTQVARAQGPYAADQKGASPPQEIRRVLGRLQIAGLIRHDPGRWSVVDPLVGAVLRREVFPAAAADLA